MVVYDVGDGLGVSRAAGPAAPDCVMHLCQFIGYAVGDVGTCCGSGVGTEDYTVGEGDCHSGWLLGRGSGGRSLEGRQRAYIEVPRLWGDAGTRQ